MFQEIYIIDQDDKLITILREMFKADKTFKFKNVKTQNLDVALKNIPELIIINEDFLDIEVSKLCKNIRKNVPKTWKCFK